ncbi:Ferritin [Gammaproteobacteria bacterium]
MDPTIITYLQKQFTLERQNEQFYRALAAAADVVNRPGASSFFEKSADDEKSHAKRIRDYIVDRNITPLFDSLEAIPEVDGNDYAGMFKLALDREQITTAALNEFWRVADDQIPDPQTMALLISSQGDWPGYLQEQTDSEREITDMLLDIARLGPDGLIVFDSGLLD